MRTKKKTTISSHKHTYTNTQNTTHIHSGTHRPVAYARGRRTPGKTLKQQHPDSPLLSMCGCADLSVFLSPFPFPLEMVPSLLFVDSMWKFMCILLLSSLLLFSSCSICSSGDAAAVPLSLSPAVLSLLSTAGVTFNFSSTNSFHQAQWVPAPSGMSNAGIIEFSKTTQEMDLSQRKQTQHSNGLLLDYSD